MRRSQFLATNLLHFFVSGIPQELAVLLELVVPIKDRHCLMYFVLNYGNAFGKATGLLARLGMATALYLLNYHGNVVK